MNQIAVTLSDDFQEWRKAARSLIQARVHPRDIQWVREGEEQNELFSLGKKEIPPPVSVQSFQVPGEFMDKAELVYAYRSADNADLLYRILWRSVLEEPHLMKIKIDPDVEEFSARARMVHRDIHKMKAFVRFRELGERFIAWHAPDHKIVRLAAPFFLERFNGMNFSIFTEDECVHWDQKTVTYTEGVPRSHAPKQDDAEELWTKYYQSIFNPARIKLKAMTKEMPVRHWRTMPETAAIAELLRSSPERLQKFYETAQIETAEKWLPPKLSVPFEIDPASAHERLKDALPSCKACGICEKATQPVMGEGRLNAEIVFVGEQPGEEEDARGIPFVGPAGQVLNQALDQVGLMRDQLYLTNAVKAYKWTEKEGVGRIHRGSSPQEIAACNPWLREELSLIKPKTLVCLGRSAAQAVLGKSVMMRDVRGKFFETPFSSRTLVVPHPSFILRIQDKVEQQQEFNRWVEELRQIVA